MQMICKFDLKECIKMKLKIIKNKLTILALFLVLINFSFMLRHYQHDCNHKKNCEICIILNHEKMNIESIALGFVPPLIICIIRFFYKKYKQKYKNEYFSKKSLVDLKIRLDN